MTPQTLFLLTNQAESGSGGYFFVQFKRCQNSHFRQFYNTASAYKLSPHTSKQN